MVPDYFITIIAFYSCSEKMAIRGWSVWNLSIIAAFTLHLGLIEGRSWHVEQELKNKLFGNKKFYNIHTRPSVHSNQSSVIDIGLSLIKILELDEATETLVANAWTRIVWYDYSLHWNSEDYGGIDVLRQRNDMLWKPDVVLANSEIAELSGIGGESLLLIYPNGEVLWVPPQLYHTTCRANLRDFPFDEHKCEYRFRSFSHEGQVLKLNYYAGNTIIDMSDYYESEKWAVIVEENDAEKATRQYQELSFTLGIKRRSCYYAFTLFVPLFLSWALLLVLFWLPPMSGEKLTLGSFTFLYHIILLVYLQWLIPHNGSKVPRLVIFSSNSLIFAGLSVILSTVTITMSRSVDTFMIPSLLGQILTGSLRHLLCLGSSTKGVSMGAKLLTSSNVELNVNSDAKEESCGAAQQEYSDWALMALALDRIFFILYCISFGSLILAYACP